MNNAEYERFLEAVDEVCMNCIEDTIENPDICENCPVRKTCDFLKGV